MKFYFDFLSPYSYLAFQWIKKNKVLLEQLDIPITYVPVMMGKLIHSYETKGPAEIESKRNFLFRDCLRYSAVSNIEFTPPKSLPFNSLYALRVALAATGQEQFDVIDAIFSAGWGKGTEIGEEESLRQVLRESGLNEELLEQTTSKEIRKALKQNTSQAFEAGVFGVPTFIYQDELFWGNDSTKYLEMVLAGKDPIDTDKYNNFLNNYPFN
jgi:2-hydroxychromene-2-carboxylate isomerase